MTIQYINRPAPFALDPAVALLGNEREGLAIDFGRNRAYVRDRAVPASNYLGDVEGKFPLVRASDGSRYDAARKLVIDGPDVLRLTHDPLTGEAIGALLEGARTTSRNVPTGGTVGVIGAGGTLPSPFVLWTSGGLTTELLAISPDGIEDGIPGIKLRIHGTMTGAVYRLQANSQVAQPADGTPVVAGFFCRAIAGSDAGLTANIRIGNGVLNAPFNPFASSRLSASRVTVGGTPGYGGAPFTWFELVGAIGTIVDLTIIIGGAHIETGYNFASSPIFTANASAMRMADNLSFARPGTPEGTVVIRGRTAAGGVASQSLFDWADATRNNLLQIRRTGGNLMLGARSNGSNMPNLVMGALGDDTDFAVVAAWKAGAYAAILSGKPLAFNTFADAPVSLNKLTLGDYSAGGTAWGGTVKSVRLTPHATDPSDLPGLLS